MSGKPIGPGRVIFHEVLPHQQADDDRRHVVWVLTGTQLMRCSPHSVRLVTDKERLVFKIGGEEDPSRWRSLADVLPKREFVDMIDQAPKSDELELPDLGISLTSERCMWVWLSQHQKDQQGRPLVIGAMGGHVDDFHRTGDKANPEWNEICQQVDRAYVWGTIKRGEYRHAGTDLVIGKDENGDTTITVDQQYYLASLQDVNIPPERLRQVDSVLDSTEVGHCRATLGALQWVAVQTQPQLSARCNLLLTEVTVNPSTSVAREIQQMVCEVRRSPVKLEFFKLPGVQFWTDVVFITMGDQAHANRPQGDSTGGMITFASGPRAITGAPTKMCLLTWRCWKLKRKAISSNDAEVQAMVESEDNNFRMRHLWCELHGQSIRQHRNTDKVSAGEEVVKLVKGVVTTDSQGGYDAVTRHESPTLGLSNMRAALQAFQVSLERTLTELRWTTSDYDSGNALTKKAPSCRAGLLQFLKTSVWSIAFDPSFQRMPRRASQRCRLCRIPRLPQRPDPEVIQPRHQLRRILRPCNTGI